MFYKNIIPSRKTKTLCVTLDDFAKNVENEDVNDLRIPSEFYNFRIENGCLEDGYGIQDFTVRTNYDDDPISQGFKKIFTVTEVEKIFSFMWYNNSTSILDANMILLDQTHTIAMFPECDYHGHVDYTTLTFEEEPYMFFYRGRDNNVIIFSSQKDGTKVLYANQNMKSYESVPKFTALCVHENCLYGIQAGNDATLLYAKNVNTIEFNSVVFNKYVFKGGDGSSLQKLFSLGDYVYLFRNNGIVKIYPYAVDKDLSITHIYYSSQYIMPNTTERCGDVILFLTVDGLFSFDGNNVKKIDAEIFKKINFKTHQYFASGYHAGKYFLACKIDFDGDEKLICENSENGYKNNAVVVYDIETGKTEVIRGVDIRGFTVFETCKLHKIACNFYNDNKNRIGEFTDDGKIFSAISQKKWTSVWTDFGYKQETKIMRNVKLKSLKNCKLTVKTEKTTQTFNISASEEAQNIKINMRGKRFQISFLATESGQKIMSPEFEIEVLL